eukprot:scaffold179189_cov18-Tisochrysis_lutea.AAC.1
MKGKKTPRAEAPYAPSTERGMEKRGSDELQAEAPYIPSTEGGMEGKRSCIEVVMKFRLRHHTIPLPREEWK